MFGSLSRNHFTQYALTSLLGLAVLQGCARSAIDGDDPKPDSGTPVVDAGRPVVDAGDPADAGLPPPVDAGETDAGPVVEPDLDNDGVPDAIDNCVEIENPDQEDQDDDDIGDFCDNDVDGDGVVDDVDNCPGVYNPNQENENGDTFGDACQVPTCGDRVLNTYEGCDDGNLNNGDGCSQNCVLEPGYSCGVGTGPCAPVCGDGIVKAPEQCDPGSGDPIPGCNDVCQREVGWICYPALNRCTPAPGDGRIVGDEACDDANMTNGDGCSDGNVDVGYDCGDPPVPGTCETVCGDGHKRGNEQCDDGNTDNGDGCSAACTLEPVGFTCTGTDPTICLGICGDGLKRGTEQCDDGNATPNDGCTLCNLDEGYECGVNCYAVCGDGLVRGPEQCDDGPGTPAGGDGCSQNCTEEFGYDCSGEPSNCTETIGDGYIVGDEQCDDGNQVSGDGCSATGQVETGYVCDVAGPNCQIIPDYGDGVVVIGEDCDDGNTNADDGCYEGEVEYGFTCQTDTAANPASVCTVVYGDGYIAGDEACDDGNLNAGDGCYQGQVEDGFECPAANQPCVAICGDGLWLGDEACDDGNVDDNDGCSAYCNIEYGYECAYAGSPVDAGPDAGLDGGTAQDGQICSPIYGDGYIVSGVEFCDDGNNDPGDGCYNGVEEVGYDCLVAGDLCGPEYGDGIITAPEVCDDSNIVNRDGCYQGQVEDGWVCSGEPSQCTADTVNGYQCANGLVGNGAACGPVEPVYGDGILAGDEVCDDNDGTNTQGDGCYNGQVEVGYACVGLPSDCRQVAGDGYAVPGVEECDDGPGTQAEPGTPVSGDGCSAAGVVEAGYVCTGGDQVGGANPSKCTADTGNGYQCTGGNVVYGAACAPVPVYGDGILAGNEVCDDGDGVRTGSYNTANDGCYNGQVETGWTCATVGQACNEIYGDGLRVGGEACDTGDANLDPDDGCVDGVVTNGYVCTGAGAGSCAEDFTDGVISGDEECDDQNTVDGDGCDANHQLEPGWDCAGEPTVCTVIYGDGYVVGNEECDDQNVDNGDGCSATGQEEDGYSCTGGTNPNGLSPSVCTVDYGDGYIVDGVEQCDDHNVDNGDGCSATGQVENGYVCTGGNLVDGSNPSVCVADCGDGYVVQNVEDCDDANQVNGDGCDANCQEELGYLCTGGNLVNGTNPSVCLVTFGDGVIVAGIEQCDDGNTNNNDGCSATGQIETGYICPTANQPCETVCGDGFLRGEEECDDANVNTGDGCSATCTEENFFTCNGQGAGSCQPICGDGYVVPNLEQCDDNNVNNNDGCSAACTEEQGFTCDGIEDNTSVCTPICGDGLVRGNEQCDDGTLANNDGCDNTTCTPNNGYVCNGQGAGSCLPDCGDGQVVADEECDDGNENNGDGCDSACEVEDGFTCPNANQACEPICGDGFINGDEVCDDGINATGDGCDNTTCTPIEGYVCVGEGAGSCQPDRKLFVTTRTFKPLQGVGYADIDAQCKTDHGDTAFFCTRADITARVNANQADPSIFGKVGWVRDFDTFGGKPGNCNDLTYNSGHLFRAHWVKVDTNLTITDTGQTACNTPNWYGHCCLP